MDPQATGTLRSIPLSQPKVDLDRNSDRHRRLAIFHRGFEFVLADCLNGLFIQPHAQTSSHSWILRIPLCVDDNGDQANSLIAGRACII